MRADEKEKVKLSAKNMRIAEAPLKKGDKAGELEIYLDNKLLSTIALEYTENVQSSSPFFYLKKILGGYLTEAN